jgi:hypothetical protein
MLPQWLHHPSASKRARILLLLALIERRLPPSATEAARTG